MVSPSGPHDGRTDGRSIPIPLKPGRKEGRKKEAACGADKKEGGERRRRHSLHHRLQEETKMRLLVSWTDPFYVVRFFPKNFQKIPCHLGERNLVVTSFIRVNLRGETNRLRGVWWAHEMHFCSLSLRSVFLKWPAAEMHFIGQSDTLLMVGFASRVIANQPSDNKVKVSLIMTVFLRNFGQNTV